jgi:purine-binding chemotaxis protein CheW
MEIDEEAVPEKEGSVLKTRYLSFFLDNELYGINILSIQEIIQMVQITRIPRVDSYVSGVINLRGNVIPIINLKKRFGSEDASDEEKRACIIVIHLLVNSEVMHFGLKVDEISEVRLLKNDEIQVPTSNFDSENTAEGFVSGMGIINDEVMTILDIEEVVRSEKDVVPVKGNHDKES